MPIQLDLFFDLPDSFRISLFQFYARGTPYQRSLAAEMLDFDPRLAAYQPQTI